MTGMTSQVRYSKKHRRVRRRRWKRLVVLLFELILLSTVAKAAISAVQLFSHENRMTDHGFVREFFFPEEADIKIDMDEDELDWVINHIDFFHGLRSERLSENAGLTHFLYCYGNGDYESRIPIQIYENEFSGNIPLYLQWDARWGYDAYGDSVIGLAGCGPSCVAMVVSGLSDDRSITPLTIANYAMNNDYYMFGTGTKWSLILEGIAAFGIEGRQIGISESAFLRELHNGNVLVLNVGNGHFTSSGHFIIICGSFNGKYIVNDPNSIENSRTLWDYKTISEEIRAVWSFGRGDL